MTAFFDLFREASRPDKLTDVGWADRRFPEVVARAPFRLWKPGDPILDKGERVLLGVATWSGYDMRLLDVIASRLSRPRTAPIQVDLFNTADCKRGSDFKQYIPRIGEVLVTPVVGVWRDGRLEEKGTGAEGRNLVALMFGSSGPEIVEYVLSAIKAQKAAEDKAIKT